MPIIPGIDGGKVIQRENYDELVEQKGIYLSAVRKILKDARNVKKATAEILLNGDAGHEPSAFT